MKEINELFFFFLDELMVKSLKYCVTKTIKIEKVKLHFVNFNYILTLRKVPYTFFFPKNYVNYLNKEKETINMQKEKSFGVNKTNWFHFLHKETAET